VERLAKGAFNWNMNIYPIRTFISQGWELFGSDFKANTVFGSCIGRLLERNRSGLLTVNRFCYLPLRSQIKRSSPLHHYNVSPPFLVGGTPSYICPGPSAKISIRALYYLTERAEKSIPIHKIQAHLEYSFELDAMFSTISCYTRPILFKHW